MFKKIADNRNVHSVAAGFRRRRVELFISLLSRLGRPVRILDLGGTENYWRNMGLDWMDGVSIILLNREREETSIPQVTSLAGDARCLDFDDASFDVVHSNSVIEHVGTLEDQEMMAREVRRVGRRYFIQTPNRHFPIEPHFLFPYFQFLPKRIQIWLLRHFKLGWFPRTRDTKKAREIVEGIRLLDRREFTSFFPEARIFEEKLFGMTKSFIACGGWNEG